MSSRSIAAIFAFLSVALCHALAADGVVQGRVSDPDGLALPGVTVTMRSAAGQVVTAVTDGNGTYTVNLPPGQYTIKAELAGFDASQATVNVGGGPAPQTVDLTLRLAAHQESVTVKGDQPQPVIGEAHPDAPESVTREVVDSSMLPNSQFDDVLPLLPNVVRAPDGSISLGGARSVQGALFVNGFNVTDPVSGQPALVLPLEAVDSMDVFSGGYSAELGRATAGVTSVHTRAGGDQFHSSLSSFMPRLRLTDGHVRGVQYWEPNFGMSGAVARGVHFEQAVSYRFNRNPIDTLAGSEDQKYDSLASWTQLDTEVSANQHLLVSFSANPQWTDHANMDAFTPAAAAPRLDRSAFVTSLADHVTFDRNSTLELRANVVQTRLLLDPQGDIPLMVSHQLLGGNYFDQQNMRGARAEASAVWSVSPSSSHFVRVGGSFGRAQLSGLDTSSPVTLLRSDGSVSRSIGFTAGSPFDVGAYETTLFVQDSWAVSRAVSLDAGIRSDRTTAIGQTVSPRVAWTIKLPDNRSTVSGSAGLFGDKLALETRAFPLLPSRFEQVYNELGQPTGAPVVFTNAIAGSLRTPVATRWDLELDEQLTHRLTARVRYQERRGRNEPIVQPVGLSTTSGLMLLSSDGRSQSRSLETTFGYRSAGARGELYASYVRSSARGDLNSFDLIEGVLREPFVQPNEVGPLAADVPHRLLVWGLVRLPRRITIAPFVEARSGFPYSAIDDNWLFAGPRNTYRFPWYGSLDLSVNKIIGLPWHLPDARVGLKIYSIVSTHSQRDIQRDIMRPDFGTLYNPVPRDFAGVFELLWGNK